MKWLKAGPPAERSEAIAALAAATDLLDHHLKRERIRKKLEKERKERAARAREGAQGTGEMSERDLREDLIGAQRYLPFRETGKHYFMMAVALVREVLEEFAERYDLGKDLYFLHRKELAELATRHRNMVLGKTQDTATRNLRLLKAFLSEHRETLGWIPPRGGVTAFPWLVSGENARPFCRAAAEQGILLAPGDCWEAPSHFRLGFAKMTDKFPEALNRLGEFVKSWSAANVTKA